MKQGHMAILFIIIYMSFFLMLLWEQKKYDTAQAEKQKMEQALLNAIEVTGREYEAVLHETEEKKQQFFEHSFFEAFYVFLNALEDKEKQEYLSLHFPMLVLVEENGAYFNYTVEEQEKENVDLLRKWSEKIGFSFPSNCTAEKKKTIMAQILEKVAADIISKHNYIAVQYGISYQFTVPEFLANTETPVEFPMLFVVFQGWPLNVSGDVTYENCMDAAVFLRRKEQELPLPDGIPYKVTDGLRN